MPGEFLGRGGELQNTVKFLSNIWAIFITSLPFWLYPGSWNNVKILLRNHTVR